MSEEPQLRDAVQFQGRVEQWRVESEVLAGNRAGDPHVRELNVWSPPGCARDESLPTVFLLCGFTGRPQAMLETHPWRRGVVCEYERGVCAGELPPVRLVLPDCWTHLGGSQYVDSSYLGNYEQHVARELTSFVAERYAVAGQAFGAVGKSSGGFGSLRLGARHPERFRAVGSISGDVGFEACFGHELYAALRGLVAHEMDPAHFLAAFAEDARLDGDGHAVLNVLAMSACYSPAPDSKLGYELPLDLHTGERIESVWQRWLAFDPLETVDEMAPGLAQLELLHLECGLRDEFHLQWGLRRLVHELRARGVACDHEEHPGGHRGIDHRWPPVLAKVAQALEAIPEGAPSLEEQPR